MAPLYLMPHAVHLFLEQVRHELWDNTFIYLNGPHVCQAGPQDYYDDEGDGDETTTSPENSLLQKFKDLQLDTLAFPEYNEHYPHEQWTMGFTGRPGGPDWYINKMNNTKVHGPGGQHQHLLGDEQADPCFGIIMEGREVLQKVFGLKGLPRGDPFAFFLEEPVEIVSARIMEPFPDQDEDGATASTESKEDETAARNDNTANRAAQHKRGRKLPRARADRSIIPENP
jgi:hypothetical protein